MPPTNLTAKVRFPAPNVTVIDLIGEVTGFAESILMDAFNQATANNAKNIILNFSELEYMNSSGIGLLVTLLIRTQRQKQALLACGLTAHYQQIFELTRLNEAIGIYPNEAEALAKATLS
jgi:anti-anti-sigma factor